MPGQEHSSERELAELAALADGSLPVEQRAALEARVAASPRLQALLQEQRHALEAVRGRSERAPEELHRRLAAASGRRRHRISPGRLAAALAAAALLAAGIVIAIPESEPGKPTIAQAAALGVKGPSPQAPSPGAAGRGRLRVRAAGLPFPDWSHEYRWRAVGLRHDRLRDRETTTVFYVKDGRQIGYTIVAGAPLTLPRGAVRASREGSVLYRLDLSGGSAVTWLRRGHTCVLTGDEVGHRTLLELASWRGDGAVPF
jgi:hypothetical protein